MYAAAMAEFPIEHRDRVFLLVGAIVVVGAVAVAVLAAIIGPSAGPPDSPPLF